MRSNSGAFGSLREKLRNSFQGVEYTRDTLPRRVVGQVPEQVVQPVVDSRTQVLQPVGDRSIGRQLMQPGEAANDQILLQVTEMAQSPPPDDQHGDQDECYPEGAVVGLELPDGVQLPEPLDEAGAIKEPPDQLQSAVGGECFLSERDGKIALDTGSNRAVPYPHDSGRSV